MKQTGIDCMKYRKSTHLAGIDVETITAEKGSCILTIKQVFYNTSEEVAGKKISGYFAEFKEDVKPMVLNSGNRKIISKIVKFSKRLNDLDSRNIGNWSDIQIELYFDPTVEMKKQVTGGIKVAEKYELPILNPNTPEFEKAKLAIEKSGFTVEQVRSRWQVSKEVEALLNGK